MKKHKEYAGLYIKDIKMAAYEAMKEVDFNEEESRAISAFVESLGEMFFTEEVKPND